ncbi:MAG: tRNA (adenosine(37)-N6)-threonylcarbamoyltransferase complex transferase subunit TsaD [Candidatus Chisholmbacteria bacterium]|nr:tRNA (adenosine(37)-N6)-threonylcarbamoyltransferase complex transferase subunit TsaD [Candidatus Chisholmbacteria bacterium]
MIILALETSCDETAAAIVEGDSPTLPVKVLASVVASSEEMHVKTGGIVPEVAAREQMRSIVPVIAEAITKSRTSSRSSAGRKSIDAIAVTVGPGLIGSLLVGVETAKTLAYVWGKPLVPVNHLVAHLYANFVSENSKLQIPNSKQISNSNFQIPKFPAIGLVVSGGHTDLVLMKEHGDIQWLGGTRDDAAGECFDKCARLLGLPYPGGPAIAAEAAKVKGGILRRPGSSPYDYAQGRHRSRHAQDDSPALKSLVGSSITLPRPLLKEETYDFSFSGLKAALRRAALAQDKLPDDRVAELAHEVQEAITDVLVAKVMRAVKEFTPKSVIVGGGVAANLQLRRKLKLKIKDETLKIKLFIPSIDLCTDNAVMVGAAAFYTHSPTSWKQVVVDPGLDLL